MCVSMLNMHLKRTTAWHGSAPSDLRPMLFDGLYFQFLYVSLHVAAALQNVSAL